jgi:uncharacterized protein with GYD domain
MTIRAILMGAYNSDGAKGIIGGSDRMAAVKAVAEAAGGSVNFVSFLRGNMDIIVDFNVPDASTMMGVVAAAHASGTFTSLQAYECIDHAPVVAAAQKIVKAYVPANA